jgi:hypothetical protein
MMDETKKGGVEGEGSYTATREYQKRTSEFLKEHGKDIPAMAEDAKKALDGPEGDALRRAEREGLSHARTDKAKK